FSLTLIVLQIKTVYYSTALRRLVNGWHGLSLKMWKAGYNVGEIQLLWRKVSPMSSATPRFFARAIILVLVCLFLVSPFSPVAAQDGGGDPLRYNDQELGIAFDLLPDWIVQSQEERISAGSASDLSRIESGLLPESLVILIRLGTYSSLG